MVQYLSYGVAKNGLTLHPYRRLSPEQGSDSSSGIYTQRRMSRGERTPSCVILPPDMKLNYDISLTTIS